MTPMSPTAVGYCRVSTTDQGERGYGLDSQRGVIEDEAARRGWHLAEVYVDVASGKTTRRRPQLERCLSTLTSGDASVLVVAKLDRLSRSVADFAGIMDRARAEGWRIVTLDIGMDMTTPHGEMVAGIISVLAQWERRIISDRTRDALAEVAKAKRLGRPPGTTPDTDAMIRVLARQGATDYAIAKALNREGLPTAQGGRSWYPSTVRKVRARTLAQRPS